MSAHSPDQIRRLAEIIAREMVAERAEDSPGTGTSPGGGGSGTVCQGQRKGRNEPIAIVMDPRQPAWRPVNYDRKFRGIVTLRRALEHGDRNQGFPERHRRAVGSAGDHRGRDVSRGSDARACGQNQSTSPARHGAVADPHEPH